MPTRSGKNYSLGVRKPPISKLTRNNLKPILNKLSPKNALMFYMGSPKNVRTSMEPNIKNISKIQKLKRILRNRIRTVHVNPAYIQVVRELHRLAPNNNNLGWHHRRIQEFMNKLRRLRLVNTGRYANGNNLYNFNKGRLTAVPKRSSGVYSTVAYGLRRRRHNGSLYFRV